MDPRIGVLQSGKFYAYVNGHQNEPVMGTREEVEVALGLREPAAKAELKTQKRLRAFEVTVTPRVVTYSGADTWGEYTRVVDALNHNDAIKKVRKERFNEDGRMAVPARYRARVLVDGGS